MSIKYKTQMKKTNKPKNPTPKSNAWKKKKKKEKPHGLVVENHKVEILI